MKRYLLLLVIICTCSNSNATPQASDKIIIENDTLLLYSLPLEDYLEKYKIEMETLIKETKYEYSTGCARRYTALWQIINKKLYLLQIQSCLDDSLVVVNLNTLFGKKYIDNKVLADWYTGELEVPYGNTIYYEHMGFGYFYEKEDVYDVEEGIIKNISKYDNSKSKRSSFETDPNSNLTEFIHRNINWDLFNDLTEEDKKVFVCFSSNEYGKIDKCEISKYFEKKYSENYYEEAVRVVKLIPEWTAIFKRGKLMKQEWTTRVVFSTTMRDKYKNQKK